MTEFDFNSYWSLEIDAIEKGRLGLNKFGAQSRKRMFAVAMEQNRWVFLNMLLDYHAVPKDLDLKQRIALYQLTREGPQ